MNKKERIWRYLFICFLVMLFWTCLLEKYKIVMTTTKNAFDKILPKYKIIEVHLQNFHRTLQKKKKEHVDHFIFLGQNSPNIYKDVL